MSEAMSGNSKVTAPRTVARKMTTRMTKRIKQKVLVMMTTTKKKSTITMKRKRRRRAKKLLALTSWLQAPKSTQQLSSLRNKKNSRSQKRKES